MRQSAVPAPLRQAAERFEAFFRELRERFIERDDLLVQIALALLSRQHVLMTGPPGTAKSQLANQVLGRIISEDTGRPSLFSRQFTESTVQTDLIGAMDFKTLMETGRTEHFTDEGILGAVHAFLDEVFDGRDMLLRSTLNLLHERELKAGTKITTGKIECALMTTNRYLAEILDNERLVAFVDRIAFLCFVPRAFAGAGALESVLRVQVAGRRPPELRAPLTIQDLDVLQAAADQVYVDTSICGLLADLARRFDVELAAARRANPTFVPSRYLSTRTVVRQGAILRAACLYEWITGGRARPLEVLPGDLAWLRLGMTLAGPRPEEVTRLLEAETDPRERRQLSTVRTESEIFARCLDELPAPAQPVRRPVVSLVLLQETAPAALSGHDSDKLAKLAPALAAAAASGDDGAADAAERLPLVLGEIVERAMRACLAIGATEDRDPVSAAERLGELASAVERAGGTHVRAARWLRGRALDAVDRILHLGVAAMGEVVARTLAASADLTWLEAVVDTTLARAERLWEIRAGLRHAGSEEPDPAQSDRSWGEAAERLAELLLPVMRDGLSAAKLSLLAGVRGSDLEVQIETLQPALALVRKTAARLGRLGADADRWSVAVLAPTISAVAQQAYAREQSDESRETAAARLRGYTTVLGAAGLLDALPVVAVLGWSLEALLLAPARAPKPDRDLSRRRGATMGGYRRTRQEMAHRTLAGLLVELYLQMVPGLKREELRDPDQVVRRVAEIVKDISANLRAAALERDLAHLDAPVSYLERWWAELASALGADPDGAPELLTRSRFLVLTHDEAALARFALEARLVGMVFDPASVEPLLGRLGALERESTGVAGRVLAARVARGGAGRAAGAAAAGS
jgi:MoxR-like ATPase